MHQIRQMVSHRNKSYLDWVRSQPCVVTGSESMVIAHHVRMFGGGGTGLKPSDYLCVPLTSDQHQTLHQMGEQSYWDKWDVDPLMEVCRLLVTYLASRVIRDEGSGIKAVVQCIEDLRQPLVKS